MTCIIGMYCEDLRKAVVIADSRVMLGQDYDTDRKIHWLDQKTVAAFAGYSGIATQLMGGAQLRLKDQPETYEGSIIRALEHEMYQLWDEYKTGRRPRFRPDEALADGILATAIQETPILYAFHENGWAEPYVSGYRATGDGDRYARQILKHLYDPKMGVERAIEVGVYILVQIARLDSVVDDNAQVAVVEPKQKTVIRILNETDGGFDFEPEALREVKKKINGIESKRTKLFKALMEDVPGAREAFDKWVHEFAADK